ASVRDSTWFPSLPKEVPRDSVKKREAEHFFQRRGILSALPVLGILPDCESASQRPDGLACIKGMTRSNVERTQAFETGISFSEAGCIHGRCNGHVSAGWTAQEFLGHARHDRYRSSRRLRPAHTAL